MALVRPYIVRAKALRAPFVAWQRLPLVAKDLLAIAQEKSEVCVGTLVCFASALVESPEICKLQMGQVQEALCSAHLVKDAICYTPLIAKRRTASFCGFLSGRNDGLHPLPQSA